MSAGLSTAGAADLTYSDSPIRPASTARAAFVGRALKGPVDEPVLVTDFTRFTQVFGGLWSEAPLSYAVEQYFEQGGDAALIVRVASGARPPTIELPAGREWLVLAGLSPGTGEHLRASVDYDGITPADRDCFNLVVQRLRARGSERVEAQEIHRRLSVSSEGAGHISRALSASRLVRLAGAVPHERPEPTKGPTGGRSVGYVVDNADGEDGQRLDDYDLIGGASLRRGLGALEGQAFNFLCIPPHERGRDVGPGVLLAAAALCQRHHALLVVDPPQAWDSAEAALQGLQHGAFHSPDAVMFFPRIETPDRLAGGTVDVASSGVVAGCLARADRAGARWWSASSPPLPRSVSRPATTISAAQALRLSAQGLNLWPSARGAVFEPLPLRVLQAPRRRPGEPGTLAARRLIAFLAQSIERGTRWVVRERDEADAPSRAQRQVLDFLQDLANQGAFEAVGLPGRPFVVCDESIGDLPATIRGEFHLLYGLEHAGGALLGWLLVQTPSGAGTRPVAVNPYALRSRA